MNQRLLTLSVTVMLLSGCVSSHRMIDSRQPYISPYSSNINDVDMSDLDENLSESEMMLTEDSDVMTMKRMVFPVAEYYALPRRGKGTINGHIYLKDGYGTVIAGANTRLYLNPITSYSQQWYEEGYLGGHKMEKADKRLYNYLPFTTANASGKFAFYAVPNGDYYLIGSVECGRRCGFETPKKIRIASKVSVYGNQIVQQDLTRDFR